MAESGGCGPSRRHSKVCVELKEDSTLMHMFKSTAECCLRGYIHTELAGIMRNDMHAKYQHVCLLFHSLHHKPSNSKSHFRRSQVKPGFATILVRFYELRQHALTVLSMVGKVKNSFLLRSAAVDKRPQIFFFLRAINFCE